jgi:hypothetical protein
MVIGLMLVVTLAPFCVAVFEAIGQRLGQAIHVQRHLLRLYYPSARIQRERKQVFKKKLKFL